MLSCFINLFYLGYVFHDEFFERTDSTFQVLGISFIFYFPGKQFHLCLFSGISIADFRAAVRKERELHFLCKDCCNSIPTLNPENDEVKATFDLLIHHNHTFYPTMHELYMHVLGCHYGNISFYYQSTERLE